jgi:hypothetical protein
MKQICTWTLTGLLVVVLATMAIGADGDAPATGVLDQVQGQMRQAPATQPAVTTQPAAATDSVLDEAQQGMQPNPVIEPSGRGASPARPAPSIGLNIDPSILGVAPGQQAPKLRREGDFVISRRGRLQPSPGGNHMLFVFEADDMSMQDPPMVLVPCQTLESMEQQVRQRGDRVVFVLSGQVLQYRGVNFLLPEMMKIDIDRGNLGN